MMGAEAFMQGYEARLGFGITRIKNQMVAPMPIIINAILVALIEPISLLNLRIIMPGLAVPAKIVFYYI
jgi:hypothetical protein